VAAVDGSFRTGLSLADASLMLEDAKTAMGTVDPMARFGGSAFGPVEVRAMSADGVTGDWLPLGTLVRLPGFKDLRCPRAVSKPCMLTGSNLFLATSIAATQDFSNPMDVPPDFTGTQLTVPHPVNGMLYVKLRDDAATVQTLTLPVTTVSQQASQPQPSAPAAPAQPDAAPGGAPQAPPQTPPDATPKPDTAPKPDTTAKPDTTPNRE
jgi:hypothetical protein